MILEEEELRGKFASSSRRLQFWTLRAWFWVQIVNLGFVSLVLWSRCAGFEFFADPGVVCTLERIFLFASGGGL